MAYSFNPFTGQLDLASEPSQGANIEDVFQIALKFSELDTPQKRADARTNLELQDIDCGTFN